MSSLATDPNTGALVAAMADRYAAADAARADYLAILVKEGGRCRGCGSHLSDAALSKHPGVCGTCWRKKKLRPDPDLLARLARAADPEPPPAPPAPAEPEAATEEKTMPCKTCGKDGHNARTCKGLAAKRPEAAKPAAAAPAKPRVVEKPKRARDPLAVGDLAKLSVPELLALRTGLAAKMDGIQGELAARAKRLEEERRAVLEAIGEAA